MAGHTVSGRRQAGDGQGWAGMGRGQEAGDRQGTSWGQAGYRQRRGRRQAGDRQSIGRL